MENNSILALKNSKLLIKCSVIIRGTEKFKVSSIINKYHNTRFCIYKDEFKNQFIKISFNDDNNTKESLIKNLSSNKNVISFDFYKSWKEIKDIFQNDDQLTLFQQKKLQVGFALKKKKKK